jgi:uncharacterized protein YkwD
MKTFALWTLFSVVVNAQAPGTLSGALNGTVVQAPQFVANQCLISTKRAEEARIEAERRRKEEEERKERERLGNQGTGLNYALAVELNKFRASKGLRPLQPLPVLGIAAAASCVAHNSRYGDLDHNAGGSPTQRANRAGFAGQAGENLYCSNGKAPSASLAINAWIDSPGHYANLIGNYRSVGHAVCMGAGNWRYYVQVFGQ